MAKNHQYRISYLQSELEISQKKTFTKWINSLLENEDLCVKELYSDLRNGIILNKIIEVLSKERLQKPNNGKMKIQQIENVNTCLAYLRRRITLCNIGAEDIVDGNPRLTLGLIWQIIFNLSVQIQVNKMREDMKNFDRNFEKDDEIISKKEKEITPFEDHKIEEEIEENRIENEHDSDDNRSSSSSLNLAEEIESHEESENCLEELSIAEILLLWCQKKTRNYPNVQIKNLKDSWRNGLAFNALVHSYTKGFDFDSLKPENHSENLNHAFEKANQLLKVPKLLDVEDVDTSQPDERVIITYLSAFYSCVENK